MLRADGRVEDLGLLGRKIVTTAGVNAVAAAFAGAALPAFKFHAIGTGTVPETVNDTALVAEVATRATGSQASATNTYTTAGTVTLVTAATIAEWGLFSAASGGTMFDRITFAGQALNAGDSLAATFVLTVTAGG